MKEHCQKKQVYLTLPQQDHECLTRMAQATGRTVPGYIRWLVNQHLREVDTHNKHT